MSRGAPSRSPMAWALRRAYHHPDDAAAREAMSTASLMGGLALANAGLGAVHGIAAPLGGGYPIPHGIACAALLPHITAANIQALQQRDPGGPFLARYAHVAEIVLGRRGATEAALLADQALRANSTRANPIELAPDELEAAIGAAL